jgi:hypothetical protein
MQRPQCLKHNVNKTLFNNKCPICLKIKELKQQHLTYKKDSKKHLKDFKKLLNSKIELRGVMLQKAKHNIKIVEHKKAVWRDIIENANVENAEV